MKTAFSAPLSFSADVYRSEQGEEGALRAKKARSFAPEGGMVGEKKVQKIFCKKIRIFIVLFEKQF